MVHPQQCLSQQKSMTTSTVRPCLGVCCQSQPLSSREMLLWHWWFLWQRRMSPESPQLRQISKDDTIFQGRPAEEWGAHLFLQISTCNVGKSKQICMFQLPPWKTAISVSFQLTPGSLPKSRNKTFWRAENILNKPSIRSNGFLVYVHK